jgi:hypothetical protein
MRHPERISVGPAGIRAEGSRSTMFVMILVVVLAGGSFFLGQWSAIVNACFGFK